ncbi:conserved hypothetical protein [Acidianus hospitalis W1]|uniref:Uncharacterized protein n=1 Tax=Acidianus hospitalis (strain W1) TaxID=933801 RepID=F4B3S8_ACIHW|nr:conserved hypothetical protein [Acidianus hospitalis W1]
MNSFLSISPLTKNLKIHLSQTTLKDIENVFKNISLFVYYPTKNNSCNNDNSGSSNHSWDYVLLQTAL